MSTKSPRIQIFLDRVGRRVRDLRKEWGWTIQRLADEASLSRRMLTQIELGQANPSLATIDRIAHALQVSFADLALNDAAASGASGALGASGAAAGLDSSANLGSSEPSAPGGSHTLAWEGPDGSTAYILGASSAPGTELWRWHLGPSMQYQAEVDRAGAEEILHVLSGTLELEHAGETVRLTAGMSTRIATCRAYSYTAGKEAPVDFIRVVIGA